MLLETIQLEFKIIFDLNFYLYLLLFMKDILEKLSSYNLFNNLLPGILFVIIAKEFCGYNLIQNEIVLGAFLYYFIGMVISRFGSVFIEPLLKKISFVKFENYANFVCACKKDDKIELLSEVNNTYRTICSLFIMLLITNIYSIIVGNITLAGNRDFYIIITLLLFMFLFAYRKQTNYITKRVIINN